MTPTKKIKEQICVQFGLRPKQVSVRRATKGSNYGWLSVTLDNDVAESVGFWVRQFLLQNAKVADICFRYNHDDFLDHTRYPSLSVTNRDVMYCYEQTEIVIDSSGIVRPAGTKQNRLGQI